MDRHTQTAQLQTHTHTCTHAHTHRTDSITSTADAGDNHVTLLGSNLNFATTRQNMQLIPLSLMSPHHVFMFLCAYHHAYNCIEKAELTLHSYQPRNMLL